MLMTFKQNILYVLFVVLSVNVVMLTAISGYPIYVRYARSADNYDTIPCADSHGAIHKCIRIVPAAGEVTNQATGASYRMIYGQ